MPLTPEQVTAKFKQRRDNLLLAFGRFIGLISIVAILSALGVAIYRKIQNRPQIEWDYVQKVYGADGRGVRTLPEDEARRREAAMHEDAIDSSKGTASDHDGVKRTASQPAGVASVPPAGIQDIASKQPAIAEVVKEFFQAKSLPELLPLVRDARRVRPFMEGYYATHEMKQPVWKGIGWAMPVEEPGYRFAYVQALFEDVPPVHVVVEETDTGFYVDWESSVHYSEVGWKDFQNSKPVQPKTFRLLASKADDVAYAVSGGGHMAVLKLKHPAEDGFIYGRFDPADPRFRALVEQLDLCQWKDVPVILRLCYPGPSLPPGEVEIAGVEGKGWLILGRTRS